MMVEIISTQIIKPSSPTPDHLKSFTLSAFDQLTPAMYVPLILFYTNTGEISIQEASDRLKKSLAITLTSFFPFAAGTIRNNTSVDCNDEGVNYREARISCNLRDILEPAPDMEVLGRLLPTVSGYADSSGVLLVQQSVFECGGMAIGFCFPHKIADMDTISSFLKSWAGACACSGDVVAAAAAPDFTLGSLFPPLDIFAWSSSPGDLADHSATDKCTYRRFVLSASQASSLQSKSRSPTVSNPTRVEAVSSLIWQCAMKASSVVHSNINPSSTLLQTVNLRKRIDPPLPDVSFGNFVGFYITRADNATDLPSLATKMRDAKEEYLQGYPRKLRSEGLGLIFDMVQQGSEFGKDGSTMYWVTSWCRFGLYEVDFGWGKPIWAGTYKNQLGNSVVVLDGRDGEGMEAWLTFPEEVMAVLENDEEFLAFAAMNPKVILTE